MRLRWLMDAPSMGRGTATLPWFLAGVCFAFSTPLALEALPDSQNLYDWMATAPLVVAGRVTADDLKYVELETVGVARGNAPRGTTIAVDLRTANRDRRPNSEALRLKKDSMYLLLLTPSAKSKPGAPPRFDLVRGVAGVRVIPQEGIDAFVDAVKRLAEIQSLGEDARVWAALRALLDDPNPLLVQTSLDLFLRYRRGTSADSARVRPLLDHPRARVRESAARFLGGVCALQGPADPAERAAIFAELAARARRDESVDVRMAATESAAATRAPGVEDLLREIARQDPDQTVRYVAERALYERRREGASPIKQN